MAADPWTLHHTALERVHDNTVALEGDSYVMRLYASGSNVNDATRADATTATNELSTANGYTAGGIAVTLTVSLVTGLIRIGCTNASWTASGAGITARYAAIVNTTEAPDLIMFSTILNNTPGDVSAAAPNAFLVQISANGIYEAEQNFA